MRATLPRDLRAAWKVVRRNRARSFLTMIGVIIGVASVISVVAIGEGVKREVSKQIDHVGSDVITVRAGEVSTQSNRGLGLFSGLRVANSLSGKDPSAIRKAAPGATVVPLTLIDGTLTTDGSKPHQTPVVATNQDLPRLLNQSMAYGTFFSSDDDTGDVAVLGQTAATNLFNTPVPLGESFTFRGHTFTIQGVFNNFAATPLANDIDFNNAVYIPNGTAERLLSNAPQPYEILVKPINIDRVDGTAGAVKQALLNNHGDTHDFSVLKASDRLAETSSTISLLTELIAGVAAISLLVGGIGIMNITYVSVTERMHEVGIRKAVGATNRQILNEFMAEAIVLSVTGGVLGVIAAGIVDVVLRVLTSLQPVIQWQVVLLSTGVSIVIGIIFGTAPALKAARKDPIAALRNE